MSGFLRKYGSGTGADVYIPLIKRGVVDFALSADWTPAAGDVKVSKDGGAAANIGTLPAAVTMGNTAIWKFVFTDAELQCAFLAVTVADTATKAVEDQMFVVETYGNPSALHAFDLDTASVTVGTNNDKTGYALTAAERNGIADAYLDRADAIETGITPRLAERYIAAACAGLLSGSQTATEVFKGIGQSSAGTTRITATVDSSGNRSAITLG